MFTIVDVSAATFTATVEDVDAKTSKAGKDYYILGLNHQPANAEEPYYFRCYASEWAVRSGVPSAGDHVVANGKISIDRDGSIGFSLDGVQVIGQGNESVADDDSEDLPF